MHHKPFDVSLLNFEAGFAEGIRFQPMSEGTTIPQCAEICEDTIEGHTEKVTTSRIRDFASLRGTPVKNYPLEGAALQTTGRTHRNREDILDCNNENKVWAAWCIQRLLQESRKRADGED